MSKRGAAGGFAMFSGDSGLPLTEQYPAHPDGWRWGMRAIVALCCVLVWTRPLMVSWADSNDPNTLRGWAVSEIEHTQLGRLSASERSTAEAAAAPVVLLRRAGVQVIRALSRRPGAQIIQAVSLSGMLLLVGELSVEAWALTRYRGRAAKMGRLFLRVRPLRPQSRKSRTPGGSPADLWRALHTVATEVGAGATPAPYVAFTLHASPQEPMSLGVVVAEGRPDPQGGAGNLPSVPAINGAPTRRSVRFGQELPTRRTLNPVRVRRSEDVPITQQRRVSLRRAIDKIITGQDAETIVDERADPLAAMLKPGMVVMWQDLKLSHAAHMLIRTSEDADGDMLGGLAASLKTPTGILHTEIQVVMRPRGDRDSRTPWRALARRRLVALRRKMLFGNQSEVKLLEAKLDGETYDVTVRLVVVAERYKAVGAGEATLREMRAAFGQYQRRVGYSIQRFKPAGLQQTQMLIVPEASAKPSLLMTIGIWTLLAVSLGAGVLATLISFGVITSFLSPFALAAVWGLALTGGLLVLGMTTLPPLALDAVLARAPRPTPPPAILSSRLWAPPLILSAEEVGGLWHLPSPTLGTLISWLPNRYLPPQPHVFIPDGADDRIVLGYARRSDGTEAPVGPSLRDLRKILHLTAGVGAGKSRALANMVEQLIPNGLFLLDGKGDDAQGSLAATSLSYVPQEDEHRLIILDLLDADWPIAMNPLAAIDLSDPVGASKALGTVMAVFSRLDPETWGKSMGMQQYAQMATMLVLAGEKHPTIAHVKQALQDEAYRKRLLPRCDNIEVTTFWNVTFPQTGDQQKTSRDALLRRFDNLLVNEITRYLLTQPIPSVDLLRAMERGDIVVVALPHVTLGKDLAGIAGMVLFQAIVRAAFQRGGTDLTRETVPLIIDEFQQFASDGESEDVRTAMTQLRSLGIGGVYAHQSLIQLGKLKDEMLQNSASRLILSTNEPDASVYARQFPGSDLTAADVDGQQFLEHQYAVFSGDQKAEVCSIRPLMWPTPLEVVAPPYNGTEGDWKLILPPGDEATCAADKAICGLIYGPIDIRAVASQLALLPDDEWDELLARWDVIRQVQRQYLIRHPGSEPDRRSRQRWLSRLGFTTPRVLAAAGYQRQRWEIVPGDAATEVAEESEASKKERQQYELSSKPSPSGAVGGVTNRSSKPGEVVPSRPAVGEVNTPEEGKQARASVSSRREIEANRDKLRAAGTQDFTQSVIVPRRSIYEELDQPAPQPPPADEVEEVEVDSVAEAEVLRGEGGA